MFFYKPVEIVKLLSISSPGLSRNTKMSLDKSSLISLEVTAPNAAGNLPLTRFTILLDRQQLCRAFPAANSGKRARYVPVQIDGAGEAQAIPGAPCCCMQSVNIGHHLIRQLLTESEARAFASWKGKKLRWHKCQNFSVGCPMKVNLAVPKPCMGSFWLNTARAPYHTCWTVA